MHTRNLSLALLSTSCLLLVACETTNPQEKLDIPMPLSYTKANKAIQPQVAQAFTLLKQEKYSEASSYINQVLQTRPKSLFFHLLNAFTYEKLAENDDPTATDLAVIGYQNALTIDPFNCFAIAQLGKIKFRNQKFHEAQEHFANALLLKPDDPNLIHELAAASYYAYDIKTALAAIRQAAEIKPEDPLVQRYAAMIYAAVGDFKSAGKHFEIFQAKAGQDPDVDIVTERFNHWKRLHKGGRFTLAAGPGAGPGGATTMSGDLVDLSVPGAMPGGPGGPVVVAPPPEPEEPLPQQVVIDAYMVEIHEDAISSKGNNILTNLAVTLNPGSYVKFNGAVSGDAFPHPPTGGTQVIGDSGSATGAGGVVDSTGKLIGNVTASSLKTTLLNTGNFSGYLFTRGISWAGLLYSLNIANAADNRIELISRPTLLTHLKQETRFFSGTELANVSAGTIGSSLSRYQIGVQVTVVPKSIVGDMVTLDIALETSNLTSVNPNILGTVVVQKTRVETTVRVRLGETIMLGGLYKRIELQGSSGVPGLRDLPVVQYFFGNETTASTRDSIALLITPRSPDVVKSAVSRAMAQEAVRPNVKELSVRNPDWFHPRPNAVNIFNYLNLDPTIYFEFRTGDILPPSWGYEPALSDKLGELASFLYF